MNQSSELHLVLFKVNYFMVARHNILVATGIITG